MIDMMLVALVSFNPSYSLISHQKFSLSISIAEIK